MASDHAPPALCPFFVCNASIRLGRALYKVDFLVLPECSSEYVLGQDFLVQYHVGLEAWLGRAWLAMEGSAQRQCIPYKVRSSTVHWALAGPAARCAPLFQP